jgi:hypothetical protein
MWKDYKYEIMVSGCLLFFIIIGLYRKITGKKGSWSRYHDLSVLNVASVDKGEKPKDSKGETITRNALETYFNKPFNKDRPDFLRNPVTGGVHNLEIDCFNSELRLGVEYNGVQHYKYTPFFHRNKDAFQNQKYRDDMKRRMCIDNGITLIEIPYTIKPNDIGSYLINQLKLNGF